MMMSAPEEYHGDPNAYSQLLSLSRCKKLAHRECCVVQLSFADNVLPWMLPPLIYGEVTSDNVQPS